MWPESKEHNPQPSLRTGYTTGTCATACCVAAAFYLLKGERPASVQVTLPKGAQAQINIDRYRQINDTAMATTTKDAGDDPDATHGATIFVELTLTDRPGIEFRAGKGVGTVTRKGLLLEVGEPAINPVPRQMMSDHLRALSAQYHYAGGFVVAVGVENGETIALKTMNPRLGIVGGLSILGTTGIVRPYSCSAWIASIHQGIDVAAANGIRHIAATTGNSSEQAIKQRYQLSDLALIEMGDFAGAVLKHIRNTPTANRALHKLSLCGGFGKISKLANGHLDLNSRASAINFEQLASVAKSLGAEQSLTEQIIRANTSIEVLTLCNQYRIDLANAICQRAYETARQYIPAHIELEILAIDRIANFIGRACDQEQKSGVNPV